MSVGGGGGLCDAGGAAHGRRHVSRPVGDGVLQARQPVQRAQGPRGLLHQGVRAARGPPPPPKSNYIKTSPVSSVLLHSALPNGHGGSRVLTRLIHCHKEEGLQLVRPSVCRSSIIHTKNKLDGICERTAKVTGGWCGPWAWRPGRAGDGGRGYPDVAVRAAHRHRRARRRASPRCVLPACVHTWFALG